MNGDPARGEHPGDATPGDLGSGGTPEEIDYDAAFAALVAQFTTTDTITDVPVGPSPEASAAPVWADGPRSFHTPVPFRPPTDDRLYPAELDEHFAPPDPGPAPPSDLISRLAWAGVLGGPLVLLVAAVLDGYVPPSLALAAVGSFAAGFVTLVVRMPRERDEDEDNGAVV